MAEPKTISGRLGLSLIKSLYYMVSTVRIHNDNNRLIRECIDQLHAIAGELSGNGDLDIQVWRGRFHVQGEKLLYQRENYNIMNEMIEYFSRRNLGGLRLYSSFSEVTPEDLVAFVRLMNDSSSDEDPFGWLEQQLAAKGFSWAALLRKREEESQSADTQRREKARHAYQLALSIVREVADKATKGVTGVRKTRRLAQTIVDLVKDDSSLMLGLATIREYDDYTYTHSVNVALLATCLGRQIGMSDILLEHLTVCGLFHDLGKVGVSKDILQKPGKLSDEEWDKMQEHPLIGVRKILRLQAPHSLKSRIVLGPFEHHLNPDMSGYPKTTYLKKLSLMGKILRIADVYEALTSERSYRPRAFSPDEALKRMWCEAGKNFDPLLLKCFINMMGIYPVGTVVELDSGERGMVMGYSDESRKDLPVVMLLNDQADDISSQRELIDLAKESENTGTTQRRIARGLPLTVSGLQLLHHLLQDGEESYASHLRGAGSSPSSSGGPDVPQTRIS